MKLAVLLILLFGAPVLGLLTWVRDRNAAVLAGTRAYARGDAASAAGRFAQALTDHDRRAPDPRLVLNLAHARAQAGQLDAAQATYGRLLTNGSGPLGSVARQQLAVLAAGRGEVAQALALLRQALLLDPGNAGARYNFEVLSQLLDQQARAPRIPTPPPPAPGKPKPDSEKGAADKSQAGTRGGSQRQGEVNDDAPADPSAAPARRPDANGQPDSQNPSPAPGNAAAGGRGPGAGAPQPVASGATPGPQRGLDRSAAAAGNRAGAAGQRPGAEDATPADLQLQTQRERLRAMNLSPAQARQLLETMSAQEQQYLQQLTPAVQQKPDPSKPTW